jgi:molecular chaperone DnaK (HSP70)
MTVIAIDFGTSNTVVSILEADTEQPQTLMFTEISRLFKVSDRRQNFREVSVIPCLVLIQGTGEIIIGEQVRSQDLGKTQPQRLFKNFKRDLVAIFQTIARQIDGKNYSSQAIAEIFIKTIYSYIQQQNIQVSQLILTTPVGAFEHYLEWLRDLGNILAVSQIKLVDESTAAALGYAVQYPDSSILVVDFGGGTLDLSLVRTVKLTQENNHNFKAEVLAKSDAYLGGEDINLWIVEDYLRQINSSRQAIGEVGWQHLLEISERLKITLSSQEEATEVWLDEANSISYELKLTKTKLEKILANNQLLAQLKNSLDEVISIAYSKGVDRQQIEHVLLVGGSCLIPAVQQLIIAYFGAEKVKLDKPFEAVSHGALAVSQLTEINDYLRHSYAIRLWDAHHKSYNYFTLFEAGSIYPCCRQEPVILQVAVEGQTEIRLDIGEVAQISEAEVIFDQFGSMTSSQLLKHAAYRSLESHDRQICIAHLNPPGELGIDRISVQFEVDRDRVLLATVKDLLTGKLLVNREAIAKLQ